MTVRLAGMCVLLGMSLLYAGCEDDGDDTGDVDQPGTATWNFGDTDQSVYVAIGDSITEGGAGGSPDGGYVPDLSSMLGQTVVNEGYGGYRSDDGLSVCSSALRNYNPGFMFIFYGANDVIHGADTQHILDNLRAMVQAAKNNNTYPVIGTVLPMYASHGVFDSGTDAINPLIVQMAAEEGIPCADLHAAFGSDESLFMGDGLHPNAAGNELIAATFYQALLQ